MRQDWIMLKNAKGMAIKGKNLDDEDTIKIGSEVRFPGYYVLVVTCMHAPEDSDGSVNYHNIGLAPSAHRFFLPQMLDCLKSGLDFSQGNSFRSEVKASFGTTVHPLGKANHFLLVVSFGRSNFRLSDESVGLALESCLGGSAADLAVHLLRDRVYRFLVSSRQVGFMVLALKSVSCKDFKFLSHLGTWWSQLAEGMEFLRKRM